jgi:hypothetical protein
VRPLLVFLVGVALVFGALAAAIVLTRPSERAFVVVDSSFPMRAVWDQVPGVLDGIADEGYADVSLATEKDLVHSWQPTFELPVLTPYAPCDLSGIGSYTEAQTADVRVLVTTPESCPSDAYDDWQVRTLRP